MASFATAPLEEALNDVIAPADQAAIDHEECSICMMPLCESKSGFFVNSSKKRTCRHYFHESCARAIASKKCPICRVQYNDVRTVANPIENPKQFFTDIDVDANGHLTYAEITEGFKCTLPLDFRDIDSQIDAFFSRWDKDKNGSINLTEFMAPDGPTKYIKESFKEKEVKGPPPRLTIQTKAQWFEYWDEDKSRSLDKGEVTRALVKTFHAQHRDDIAREIRSTLDGIWPIFDNDNSGTIEYNEFIKEDNLADTIIATVGN